MSECLECRRLRAENERQSLKIAQQAQRWINLKRFVIEQDKKAVETLAGKMVGQ